MQGEPRVQAPGVRVARVSALAAAAVLLLGGTVGAGAQDGCTEPRSAKIEGWSVTIRASGPAKTEPSPTCVRNIVVIKPVSDPAAAGLLARHRPNPLFSVRRD